MDLILFFIGLIKLFTNKLATTITIIFILCSTYLQYNIIDPLFTNAFFVHNVSDVGIVLYILFFIKVAIKKGLDFRGPFQKVISIFLIYILFNGLYDCFYNDTPIGDVVRFLRSRILLTVVYIAPNISHDIVNRSFRQIGLITIISSILIILQTVTTFNLVEFKISEGRGIKPPITSIIFSAFYLMNYWDKSKLKAIIAFVICFIPIALNLKMTYAISVFLITLLAILFRSKVQLGLKILYLVIIFISSVLFLNLNDTFSSRLSSMVNETNTVSTGEVSGNFSYRILHAKERYDYITNNSPIIALRGIGYISEKNYRDEPFYLGVYNKEKGQVDQLDNGDILWSNIFVRVGLFGLFLYICMYITLIKGYYKLKCLSKRYALWCSYLLVTLMFTSFGNETMWYGYFFFYPILIYKSLRIQ